MTYDIFLLGTGASNGYSGWCTASEINLSQSKGLALTENFYC